MTRRMTIGTDLVHVPGVAEQLARPGTRFAEVFSATERRVADAYPEGARRAEHLAGRWAVKEAFLKAWSQARYGAPPVLTGTEVVWRDIDTRPDAWGRIALHVSGVVRQAVDRSLGDGWGAEVSVSHDGDYALATCLLTFDAQ